MSRAVACGAALVALTACGLPLHDPGEVEIEGARYLWFVGLLLLCGGIYLVACRDVLRGAAPSLRVVLGVAVAMRLLAFASPPNLSSDIYRYVWDGRMQGAGINPYLYIPADPALERFRDADVYENMNRADTARTIYAPAAQVVFAAVDAVRPGVWGVKAAVLLLECVAIGALLWLLRGAGLPMARVALYAWCPMPVWEYAGNGHIDGAALGFVALAVVAAVGRRQGAAGALLAVATLCKFLPVVIAPALWARPRWRAPAVFVACVVGLYALYIGAGERVFGFLGGYAAEEGLRDGGGIAWIAAVTGVVDLPPCVGRAWLFAGGLALVTLTVKNLFRVSSGGSRGIVIARDAAVLAGTLTVIITPHYPWYLGWLVWFGGLAPSAALLWLGASAPAIYLDARLQSVWFSLFCYLPFVVLVVRRNFRSAECPPR